MVLSKKIQEVSKEMIFSKLDHFDIYHMYVPDMKIKVTMHSPLRQDKNPSWGVFPIDDRLVWKDLATGESGDCIRLVEKMFGLDYGGALKKIAHDFMLVSGSDEYKRITAGYVKPIMDAKRWTLIQVTTKKFTQADIQYWNQYGVNVDQLKQFDVYSIKELYINRQRQKIEPDELIFGYLFKGSYWKIYRPYSADCKWKGNVPQKVMHGIEHIRNAGNVLITKSLKDEICLRQIIPTICSTQNESTTCISDENINYLQENADNVYINFDNDKTGIETCSYYNQFGFKWLNVPKGIEDPNRPGKQVKDFSDWIHGYGIEPVIEYFRKKKVI